MVKELKKATKTTKHNVQTAYEVLALSAAVAAAVRVAGEPRVNDLPVWQVVAAVVLAGVLGKVFTLLSKEN